MTLQEMLVRRDAALASARSLMNELTDETPEARATEIETQHDAAMAEFDKWQEKIDREQRMRAADTAIENEQRAAADAANRNRPGGSQGAAGELGNQEPVTATYDDAFFDLIRNGGDPANMQNEMREILRAGHNPISTEERQQLTTTDTAGGYTVPTLLQDQLIIAMAQNGPMYDADIVTELNTATGANMDYPTINDLDQELDKLPEGTEVVYDAGKAFVLGKKTLSASLYDSGFIKLSRELVQDSNQAMVQVTSDLLGERAGRTANKLLTVGTGINEPEGIIVGSSLGHTSVAPGAIAFDDLFDLEHSVNAIYRGRPKSRWQLNDTTLKGIRKIKDNNGNYIWQARDVKKGTPETLLGYALSINPDLPDVATGNSPVIFGDHGKYITRKIGNIIIGVAKEKFWPNLGLAAIMRFDGRVTDARALKRLEIG